MCIEAFFGDCFCHKTSRFISIVAEKRHRKSREIFSSWFVWEKAAQKIFRIHFVRDLSEINCSITALTEGYRYEKNESKKKL